MMPSFLSEVEWLLHFLMVYVCNSYYHFPYLHYYSTHSTPIIIEINLSLLLLPSFLVVLLTTAGTGAAAVFCCCGGGGGDIIRLAPRLGFTYTHSLSHQVYQWKKTIANTIRFAFYPLVPTCGQRDARLYHQRHGINCRKFTALASQFREELQRRKVVQTRRISTRDLRSE